MNSTILIFVCIITAISAMAALVKQLQMLQQNSYYPSRYAKWLYDSYFSRLVVLTVVFCLLSMACRFNMILELVLVSVYAAAQIALGILSYRKSIKKLVFTARICRLFIAALIICAVLIVLSVSEYGIIKGIAFSLLMLVCVCSPLLVFVCWAVTYPIERLVSEWYINDAKKILKNHNGMKVIGVTGSYGKTGTKFILSRILSEKFNVVATPQSYNTPMGVVRTIREKINPQAQVFVCEMGAKNIGDIKEICDIVNPQYGIITSVGPQHLETFKSVENVFKTKFELYDACTKNGGNVFVNGDSKAITDNIGSRECSIYGINNKSGYYAENIKYSRDGSTFTLCCGDVKTELHTRLLGMHNVLNITGAAALAASLGIETSDLQFAVSRLDPVAHRLELKNFTNGSLVIDDAYNANPEGCIEAVHVLSCFCNMRKVIVTPGLVELGDKEYDFNYKLGLAAAQVCDIIILVGKKRSAPMNDAIATTDFDKENVYVVSSFAEAMSIYNPIADSNTVVLLENDLPDNYLN